MTTEVKRNPFELARVLEPGTSKGSLWTIGERERLRELVRNSQELSAAIQDFVSEFPHRTYYAADHQVRRHKLADLVA